MFFCVKRKTAYEMRISDWSSDVCSSVLGRRIVGPVGAQFEAATGAMLVDPNIAPENSALSARRASTAKAPQERGAPGVLSLWFVLFDHQIGRASCRERVCQSVSLSVVAVSLQNTTRYFPERDTNT